MGVRTAVKAALGFLVAVAGWQVAVTFATTGSAGAATSTFEAPVFPGDFPDPSLLLSDGRYWAYATGSAGRNLQVMTSGDLRSWSAVTDPLPVLPGWASSGRTWAPGVIRLGGWYLMYYTVHDPHLGMQCISVATSATPGGPFVDRSTGPLVCQTADGGSIDPNPYLDPVSGNLYLIWKSDDNSIGLRTRIWAEQLVPSGHSFAAGSSPALLLSESAAWQSPTVEGPTLLRHGGTYYLFYGANNYDTASSAIGYATSSSLLGAYTNRARFGPWVGTTGNAQGPQGPMVFTDVLGATRMAFAAWDGPVGYQNGGVRSLWIGSLGFTRFGTPILS
jgi:beta-xylosidase